MKRYSSRKKEERPKLEMKIVRKKSGAYEVRFSMLELRALEEYHRNVKFPTPRRWSLSEDESRLILE